MRRMAALLLLMSLIAAAPRPAATPDFTGMEVQPFDPPKPAPAFALPALDGTTVRLEDLRGKVLMLVFWATW